MSNLPNPTPQGEVIISTWNNTKSSIMVNALAGTGKTTFLRQLARHIRESQVLCLAFNKKNADEMRAVLPTGWDVATLNSIGHRALGKSLPRRPNLQSDKSSKILKQVLVDFGIDRKDGMDQEVFGDVLYLVRMAKSYGLMHKEFANFKSLLPDNDESWETLGDLNMIDFDPQRVAIAREVLRRSIKAAFDESLIDYDDQIYLSVLAVGAYQKYPVVLVDEAQDLSAMNHLQLKKSLQLGGRLVVVGDPRQAIYAFRGASSKSMEQIKDIQANNFQEFPLSLTFRCPKAVVARQQEHAPGYEAAPANREGIVLDWRHIKDQWNLNDIQFQIGSVDRMAILCRNTAPLLSAAFRLIRNRIGVSMLGRDIGKNLEVLLKKIAGQDMDQSIETVVQKVEAWRTKEKSLALANGKEEKIAQIEDRAECLLAVAEGVEGTKLNMKAMLDTLIALFEDQSGRIVLGTGHKSKGMEWPVVIHLDPWRIPSKFAKRAEEAGDPAPMEQENNLRYVIETRTQNILVLANLEQLSYE